MTDSKGAFEKISGQDVFQRVDASHILDLYYGLDSQFRYTLLLVSSEKPLHSIVSSRMISVELGRRQDGKWALSFSLTDDSFKELFFQFCADMVESSRTLNNVESGPDYLSDRYDNWKQMLAESKANLLSYAEVKGLIGEMLFMKNILFPVYGKRVSVEAWTGPRKTDQDFIFSDTWYEVKAVTSDATEVRISSAEQLDCPMEGTLGVVALEQTSSVDECRININKLYMEILGLLEDDFVKGTISRLLFQMGYYPRAEYDDVCYRLCFIDQYRITRDFPCIRRDILPESVGNVRYTLSLSGIKHWQKEHIVYGC